MPPPLAPAAEASFVTGKSVAAALGGSGPASSAGPVRVRWRGVGG